MQTWRHEGAYRGRAPQLTACAPPNESYAPPSEDCALKKLTGSGLLERKSRSKLVFFVEWHQILWRFWDEDLFFLRSHPFSAGKIAWISDFGRKNPLWFQWRPFFFLFFFLRSPVFGRKNRLNFRFQPKNPLTFSSSLCLFDPDWDKFLVPLCPSRIDTK